MDADKFGIYAAETEQLIIDCENPWRRLTVGTQSPKPRENHCITSYNANRRTVKGGTGSQK